MRLPNECDDCPNKSLCEDVGVLCAPIERQIEQEREDKEAYAKDDED